jgi:hypothetical protein
MNAEEAKEMLLGFHRDVERVMLAHSGIKFDQTAKRSIYAALLGVCIQYGLDGLEIEGDKVEGPDDLAFSRGRLRHINSVRCKECGNERY